MKNLNILVYAILFTYPLSAHIFFNNTHIPYTLELQKPQSTQRITLQPGHMHTTPANTALTSAHFIPGNPQTAPLSHLASKHLKNQDLQKYTTLVINQNNQITAYPLN